jgi:hypothetical protein
LLIRAQAFWFSDFGIREDSVEMRSPLGRRNDHRRSAPG